MKATKRIYLSLMTLLASIYHLHAQSLAPAQQTYFKASNPGARNEFGWSVAVSGNTAVVAAQYESSNATGVNGNQTNNSAFQSGAAYVFVRDGSNWIQQAYLKASNTGGRDWFGYSVSISGDTIVVGAPLEDSNGIGVNGNQTVRTVRDSGAVYVFTGFGAGTRLALAPGGSGGYLISFKGIPDLTYRLQRAPSLTGPWDTIATNTAPASGLIQYHETTPPSDAAFYRTTQP